MSSQPPPDPPPEQPSDPGAGPSSPGSGPGSGPPAGPPSGPLSGPGQGPGSGSDRTPGGHPPVGADSGPLTEPIGKIPDSPVPPVPPSGPPSRPLAPSSGGDGKRPWWRGRRGVLVLAGALVAACVALVLVLTNKPSSVVDVALTPAADVGPDPFTGSVAAAAVVSPPPGASASAGGTRSGSDPGLYGGSKSVASCDVPQLDHYLNENPDKAAAWATVEGIQPSDISGYLGGLTSVVLREDTRVTNHGFSNGQATPYQAVLQAGTAVLVDSQGVPRVRCACGNPLLPPKHQGSSVKYSGIPWPSFHSDAVVVVSPAPSPVPSLAVVDPNGATVTKPVGSGSASASAPPSGHGSASASKSGPSGGSSPPVSGPSTAASSPPAPGHSSAASPAPVSPNSPAVGPSSGGASVQSQSAPVSSAGSVAPNSPAVVGSSPAQ